MTKAAIKTIGTSGQITLGKKYAGESVQIEEVEEGVWILKLGRFVPDSERWLESKEVRESLERAEAWADENPARPTSPEILEKIFDDGDQA